MSFIPETQTDPVRQTEVQAEFGRIEECTSYIDKCVEELEARLSHSILAQTKPSVGDQIGQPTPEPVRVPLAQSLYQHGSRLENIRERLSSILSRLEA